MNWPGWLTCGSHAPATRTRLLTSSLYQVTSPVTLHRVWCPHLQLPTACPPMGFASLHLNHILNQTKLPALTPTALTRGRHSVNGRCGEKASSSPTGSVLTLHLPCPTIAPHPPLLPHPWAAGILDSYFCASMFVNSLLKSSWPPGFVLRQAHCFDLLICGSRKPLLIKGREKGKGFPWARANLVDIQWQGPHCLQSAGASVEAGVGLKTWRFSAFPGSKL